MKHPIRDRIVILLFSLVMLACAVGAGAMIGGFVTVEQIVSVITLLDPTQLKHKFILAGAVLVFFILFLLLFSAILPRKKKRSSNFAIQQNENGAVRISLKAIDTLVQKCLDQHAELKVVTSSLYSDEQSVRVDVHINLATDISMPLAISALQKQIKKYLEACSGISVCEVRVFVDGTMTAPESVTKSRIALPSELLGWEFQEALPDANPDTTTEETPVHESPVEEEPAEADAPLEAKPETEAETEGQSEPVYAAAAENDEPAAEPWGGSVNDGRN